jgi:hypothetical protein
MQLGSGPDRLISSGVAYGASGDVTGATLPGRLMTQRS